MANLFDANNPHICTIILDKKRFESEVSMFISHLLNFLVQPVKMKMKYVWFCLGSSLEGSFNGKKIIQNNQ